jgi:hypothetical protein
MCLFLISATPKDFFLLGNPFADSYFPKLDGNLFIVFQNINATSAIVSCRRR